jgi:NTP pyrophosphatase (non-canonical NTP hydrolase)
MTLNDYQTQAMRFRLPTADETYALLNLAGEVGELLGAIAKVKRDRTLTTEEAAVAHFENIKKELGDILWHVAAIAHDYGYGLDEIANGNITKLSSRQARGQLQGSGDNR